MNRIRQQLGVNSIHRLGYKGQGVTVAVLDTGFFPHKDLLNAIHTSINILSPSFTPSDDNSHGTHVCGIIAGSGLMSNGLYTGMAPEAALIPIKVLDKNGKGDSKIIIEGLNWIYSNIEKYNIKIVNISIGTRSSNCSDEESALIEAVDRLWDCGLFVIVSAGNNGPEYQTITTPGISRKVITVGSSEQMKHTDRNGHIYTTFSGKGPTFCNIPKPDIVAPGSHIISCYTSKNGYISKNGTSMSTPIVSGAAALLLSYNSSITNNQFKEMLCISATDLGEDRYTQGCGEINVKGLFTLAKPLI